MRWTSTGPRWRPWSVAAAVALLAASALWYRGLAPALTPTEVDAFVQRIATLDEAPFDAEDLRVFLAEDDGAPFYMFNLIRFRERARYDDGRASDLSGREAAALFNTAVTPLLLTRGSHPIFGGAISLPVHANWDLVGIVRHRSRRDMAELFASDEFAAALPHRSAGVDQRIHFPVRGLDLPSPFSILLTALVLGYAVLRFTVWWRDGSREAAS